MKRLFPRLRIKRATVLVGLCLLAIGGFNLGNQRAQEKDPATGGPYNRLVILGATLIDGTGAPPLGPIDIVIEKNIITQIIPADPISIERRGSKYQRPTGDRVIKADGMYVMPGIIDVHTHMSDRVPAEYIYKLWLGHGITTVRIFSIGSKTPDDMVAEKRRIASNEVIAPRMYVYPFWREGPSGSDSRFYNAEGAQAVVREWKSKGVDGIKITGKPGLYPEVLRAICQQARKLNMGVAVHIGQDGVIPMTAVEVARAGVTTIEHHYGYAEAAFSEKTIQNLPPDYNYLDEPARFRYTAKVWLETDLVKLHGQVLQILLDIGRQTGFTMDPTFAVYEGNRDLARVQTLPWHARFTIPALMEFWRPNPRHHGSYHYQWTSEDEAAWGRMFRRWMEFVNEFKNQGGHVSVGSDAGSLYDLYGFGTIREMEVLQHAGFHPLEVIRSATFEGGRVLGNDRLGVLRPGYLADLVVCAENPLADIKVLYGTGVGRLTADGRAVHKTGVKYTIRDGVVIDAQAFLHDVENMVKRAKSGGQQ